MATKSRLEEIRNIRLQKLDDLRGMGIDPYPARLREGRQEIKAATSEMGNEASLAGRILGVRGHGKIYFMDIADESGKVQLLFQRKALPDGFGQVELFDIGDFLWARGKVFQTESGETTVDVADFQLLAKSIRPLPSSWHGLKDVEERYRKRYLDTMLNPEAKARLRARSKVISAMREFLDERGFLEVETPTLQPIYGGGFARPFVTYHNALEADFYLRISDEMYLKRLIVGGFDKVYEITKVFRNEGVDHDHNPEFTMFEAQVAYEDYIYGMDLTEEMLEHVANASFGVDEFEYEGQRLNFKRPWKRTSVVEAIEEYAGLKPLEWGSLSEAKDVVKAVVAGGKADELDRMGSIGEVIAFAFEEMVEEKLIQPTFVYDYPVEVSPLAKKSKDPRFTERFELFAFGMELGNNYSELNDPVDLRQRFVEEKKREQAGFDEAHQTDEDYLEAIEHGFPPTSGLGIGIDRLVMLLTGSPNIKEVIAFPTLRPKHTNDKK